MMKRILCMLLCMLMAAPAALADNGETPMKRFRKQVITGGNGIGGAVYISASGVADWVGVLLPFTAGKMNIRLIGQAQGDKADGVDDVNDWQFKIYTKDAQEQLHAITHLYGDQNAMYFQSELLPDVLLTLPVEDVQPLYQMIDGELFGMISAFDPLGLNVADSTSNTEVYAAMTDLMQIDEEEWTDKWEPVLARYYTNMDMWLSLYTDEPVISGGTGSMTMSAAYRIPSADFKTQMKYIIGMMVYDSELQNLLLPYVTMEQRMLYLNPSLIYFYEYCIDSLPIEGDILLKREMTAKGETIGTTISLPVPHLPQDLTKPLGEMLSNLFDLPYTDMLEDVQRVTFTQAGGDVSIDVACPQRTVSFIVDEIVSNAESAQWEGFIRITPAVGNDEVPLSAAFTYKNSHRIWEDDEWVLHENFLYAFSIAPDLSLLEVDDPFRSSYADFAPVSAEVQLNFSLETEPANRPVMLDLRAEVQLPDGMFGVTADLRTLVAWPHEELPTKGADDVRTLSEERIAALLAMLTENAIETMTTINNIPVPTQVPEVNAETEENGAADASVQQPAAPAPTEVPPMQ